MKTYHVILGMLLSLCWILPTPLSAEIISIQVDTPGTLSSLLTATGLERTEIKELKLSGNILPKRTSDDWQSVFTCTELEYLDISDLAITTLPYEDKLSGQGYSFHEVLPKLKTIYLPRTLKIIHEGDFYEKETLEEIVIYEGVTEIRQAAFRRCTNLKSIILPASLRTFEEINVFKNCTKLESVTFKSPTQLRFIPEDTFYDTGLKSIILPEGLKSIQARAFANCEKLESITLPTTLGYIGNWAFQSKQPALRKIYIKNPIPSTSLDEYAFSNANIYRLYVPIGSLSKYRTTNVWKELKNIHTEPTTVHVRVSSLLPDLIGDNKNEITDLKITGEIDGTDILWLREMSGRDKKGNTTEGELIVLDLSETNIVEGGDRYYESGSSNIGESKNDTLADYAFYNCKLDSLIFPTSIHSMGKYVLSQSNIRYINIPEGVKSVGDRAFSSCYKLKDAVLPSSLVNLGKDTFSGCNEIVSISISDQITDIPDFFLSGCSRLSSLTLPSRLKTIGAYAFNYMYSLEKISIPEEVTSIGTGAFEGCQTLSAITLPEGIIHLENKVFSNCTELLSLTLPAKIKSIGNGTFSGCSKLENITLPASLESIGSNAFERCGFKSIAFPEAITKIEDSAFSNCADMGIISFPKNSSSDLFIGSKAFYGCNALQHIFIPANVISIGNMAFSSCIKLESFEIDISNKNYVSVDGICFTKDKSELIIYPCNKQGTNYNIPSSVKLIATYAFGNCTQLKNVLFPDGLETIGSYAFLGCNTLSSIALPVSVTYIGNNAFQQCESLVKATLPDNTVMGSSVFYDCTVLKTINLPTHLTEIPAFTFYRCHLLRDITLPENVTSIGNYAFYDCKQLISITIPTGVTFIGNNAFNGCTKLEKISNANSVPQSIDTYTFKGVDYKNCILAIPYGSLTLYQSANEWKDFLNIKEEITTNIVNTSFDKNQFFEICTNHIKGTVTVPSALNIYTINGQLIKSCTVSGDFIIPLDKGLYIIKLDKSSHKIHIF